MNISISGKFSFLMMKINGKRCCATNFVFVAILSSVRTSSDAN